MTESLPPPFPGGGTFTLAPRPSSPFLMEGSAAHSGAGNSTTSMLSGSSCSGSHLRSARDNMSLCDVTHLLHQVAELTVHQQNNAADHPQQLSSAQLQRSSNNHVFNSSFGSIEADGSCCFPPSPTTLQTPQHQHQHVWEQQANRNTSSFMFGPPPLNNSQQQHQWTYMDAKQALAYSLMTTPLNSSTSIATGAASSVPPPPLQPIMMAACNSSNQQNAVNAGSNRRLSNYKRGRSESFAFLQDAPRLPASPDLPDSILTTTNDTNQQNPSCDGEGEAAKMMQERLPLLCNPPPPLFSPLHSVVMVRPPDKLVSVNAPNPPFETARTTAAATGPTCFNRSNRPPPPPMPMFGSPVTPLLNRRVLKMRKAEPPHIQYHPNHDDHSHMSLLMMGEETMNVDFPLLLLPPPPPSV